MVYIPLLLLYSLHIQFFILKTLMFIHWWVLIPLFIFYIKEINVYTLTPIDIMVMILCWILLSLIISWSQFPKSISESWKNEKNSIHNLEIISINLGTYNKLNLFLGLIVKRFWYIKGTVCILQLNIKMLPGRFWSHKLS